MDPRFVESGAAWYSSPVAGELTVVLKNGGPGKLFYLRVHNTTGAVIFIFVFDANSAAGALVMPPFAVPANGDLELKLPSPAVANVPNVSGTAGLTISASTGATAYVAAGANAMQAHALFK